MSVLIVEDNEFLGELFEMAFKSQGYKTQWCSSGKWGETYALEEKPEIILLDIMMPDRDGLSILKTIRPELPDSKIIICSNLNQPQYLKKAEALGANLVLDKSAHTPNEIVELVKAL